MSNIAVNYTYNFLKLTKTILRTRNKSIDCYSLKLKAFYYD